MRHLSLALLAAAGTAACSSYSPPPDADATIAVTGPVTALYISDGKTCESRKAVPKDQWSRLLVRSGQPVTVEYWYRKDVNLGSTWCDGAIELLPRPGGTYTAEFVATFEGQFLGSCSIRTRATGATAVEHRAGWFVRPGEKLSCAN